MVHRDLATTPEQAATPALEALGSRSTGEFIRYGIASLLALTVDVLLLALLTDAFDVPYLISGAIAFIAGVLTIYILSVGWVFDHRAIESRLTEFALFAAIGVIGLIINEAVLYLFTGVLGLHYLLSKIGSVILVFSWNFSIRKRYLF